MSNELTNSYPNGWKVLKFKNCVTINNGKDYKEIEVEEGFPVIGSGGQFTFASQYLYDGEAVLLGRKGTIDKPLYINGPFWVVDTMFYATPIDGMNCKFLYYLSNTFPFKSISTSTALPSMTQSELYRISVCVPQKEVQNRIVTYLDTKTAAIDKRIAVLEKKQEVYSRLRKSIINRAVTRGLNPNVPLKDSGVEWIGMIPENWEVAEIKSYCLAVFAGATPSTRESSYWDGNIPWIPSGSCHDSLITEYRQTITVEGFNNSSTKLIPAETAVMAMTGATCANTGYLTFESCANQSVCAYIENKTKCYSKFLFYILQAARSYILTFQTGGAQAGINVQDCSNLKVPYVLLPEQRAIADYLDEKCAKIDAAVAHISKQIDALKRLKRALINEVVTGKRKV